jgi:hypothetical protein
LEKTLVEKTLVPTFHWAQMREYVVMEVFLTDGHVTCTDYEQDHVDLYSSGVELVGRCIEGGVLYRLKLKLNFWDDIVRLNSLYNLETGKYVFMLKKKSFVKWVSFTKENFGPIWKEMQDKYDEDERKNRPDDDEDDEDDDDDDMDEVKTKKKRRPEYGFGINGKNKNYNKKSYWG